VIELAGLPASHIGRRQLLFSAVAIVVGAAATRAGAQDRRYRIAFANLNDDPAVRVEGLGFTGAEIRRSFELAVRTLPVDLIYYDNGGDGQKALANADDAISRKVDLLIEYNADAEANAEIARKMHAAGIRVLALTYPVPGAPLYTADNLVAGRIAGKALGEFAKQTWQDETVIAVVVGDLGDPGTAVADRVRGIEDGLGQELPDVAPARIDTSGNPVRTEGLLTKFLLAQTKRKILVAALDDATALAAKGTITLAGRINDCVIAGLGLDRSVHGGTSEKKEIDPNNRGSIVLGSVAFYLDRYGYDVLPIALSMLRGEPVPPRTVTQHVFVSGKNVFAIYPPYDMN